jgi:hypothetical protein
MDQKNLYRRLMPRPKVGRSRPTTAAAAPTALRLVHLQVVGREQMAIAADTGYAHGLENTFRRKAQDMSFGCSKARPRYHVTKSRRVTAVERHGVYSQPAVELRPCQRVTVGESQSADRLPGIGLGLLREVSLLCPLATARQLWLAPL